jgi:hypothetical protein
VVQKPNRRTAACRPGSEVREAIDFGRRLIPRKAPGCAAVGNRRSKDT